jgi:hypothetical protein
MKPTRRLDRIARGRRFASPAWRLLAEAGAAARNRPAGHDERELDYQLAEGHCLAGIAV